MDFKAARFRVVHGGDLFLTEETSRVFYVKLKGNIGGFNAVKMNDGEVTRFDSSHKIFVVGKGEKNG